MNPRSAEIDEDTIDIKEVFQTVFRFRYMIVFIVVLFGLGSSYYAYFKPDIYQASATVEVGLEQRAAGQDILAMATDPGSLDPATEMEIIQSRFLVEKALKSVDFSHRYYTTRRYKEIELYKDSPFEVGMLKGYGVSFDLTPIDEKSYRLAVDEAKDENGKIWSYDKVLPYANEIVTEHFHLNVIKTKKPQDAKYRFVILNPENLASMVKGGVSVEQLSRYSTILQISYADNVALRAQEFANALASAYIEQNIDKKTQEATRKLTFVDDQLKKITENLKGSAVKLEEFKISSNTVNLSSKAENIIRQMSENESKLAEITIEEEMLQTLYKQVQSGQNLESIVAVGSVGGQSLSSMIKELQDAILKKKALRQDYTEMYPEVRKLSDSIGQLKKVIISTIKNLRNSIKRMYGQLQRKFVVNEKIYSYLLEKRSETAIIKASTVSNNRVLDSALLPVGPIKPKRQLIVLVGLILGLVLGIALAFLRAFLDDRIKEEEDVTKHTHVPILGNIPHIKESNEKVFVSSSPKSAIAESFRNLRTNLQFMAKGTQGHVIAVTSTVGGEGKTTVCINLGAIMSMSEKKTVILNLDMRKPTLHQ
ncbi:MAG: capsular biosynthesis protein, partial [Sulfurovum sp. 16-42-52]